VGVRAISRSLDCDPSTVSRVLAEPQPGQAQAPPPHASKPVRRAPAERGQLAEVPVFQKQAPVEGGRTAKHDQPAPPARDDYPSDLITAAAQDPPGVGPAWQYMAPQLDAGYDVAAQMRRMTDDLAFSAQMRRIKDEHAQRIAESAPVIAAAEARTAAHEAAIAKIKAEGKAREAESLKQQRVSMETGQAAAAAMWSDYDERVKRRLAEPDTFLAQVSALQAETIEFQRELRSGQVAAAAPSIEEGRKRRHLADAGWKMTTDWIEKGRVTRPADWPVAISAGVGESRFLDSGDDREADPAASRGPLIEVLHPGTNEPDRSGTGAPDTTGTAVEQAENEQVNTVEPAAPRRTIGMADLESATVSRQAAELAGLAPCLAKELAKRG